MPTIPAYMQLMDDCAQYAVDCYIKGVANDLGLPCPDPTTHDLIPEGFRKELRMLAHRSVEAVQNPYQLPWDSLSYASAVGGQDGKNAEFEASLRESYPPLELPGISSPCTFIDDSGEVQVWYLPDALTAERQDQIAKSVSILGPALGAHPPKETDPAACTAWRHAERLFAVEDHPLLFGRGSTTLSPGWLAQGFESARDPLHISRDLASTFGKVDTPRQESAQAWLGENMELGLLVSSALAIAHPEQYRITRQALAQLSCLDDFRDHVENWTFAFNVLTVIANRLTPMHRDRASGARELFDLLLSIGGGLHTTLSLPGLGARLQYDSGTMVLLSGSIHLHEVSAFEMERLCIACYARPAVLRWLGQRHPRAPTAAGTMPTGWWEAIQAGLDTRRVGGGSADRLRFSGVI